MKQGKAVFRKKNLELTYIGEPTKICFLKLIPGDIHDWFCNFSQNRNNRWKLFSYCRTTPEMCDQILRALGQGPGRLEPRYRPGLWFRFRKFLQIVFTGREHICVTKWANSYSSLSRYIYIYFVDCYVFQHKAYIS